MNARSLLAHEWRALIQDKRLLATLLFLPLGYMILFGFLYGQEKVLNIPIVYIDEDRSVLSGQILQAITSSETFELMGPVASEAELIDKVKSGVAYAGFILPADLSQQVSQSRQGEVMAIIDGSNLMIANRALSGFQEIVQTYSVGISMKRLEANGISPEQSSGMHMGYRLLFNPGNSYTVYLLIGLLGTVLQSVTMLGMTLSLTRERAAGTKAWNYFVVKAIPYFLIGLFNVVVALGVLTQVFHIPFLGKLILLFGLALAFVLSLIGFSFLVSLFSKTNVQATQITMLLVYPSFFLSGFTWPFSAMPSWVSLMGHLLPVSYFLHGLREIAIKGNGWGQISPDVVALLAFAVITTALTFVGHSFTKRHNREDELYESV
ncbi:ABC transporter permease [Ammoniphilus resinae]|uniref:ABC-2 type transport system permease protein n=1 Tax=Ammoniphilus resinae TaxID=861532 RepID=A0ABS4GV41_9BACL|nr:ABC transporter permease [Ammoniphilus resinae]MBP1934127.1 ABC-2 type transport system permease protein [Ammoniphilus resinae]